MKPITIIKLGESPATVSGSDDNFEHWIAAGLDTRLPVQVVDPRTGAELPAPASLAGAVLTGSQFMVTDRHPWSERTADWLRGLVQESVPVLGICYGHQLLAHACGGRVDYHPDGLEIGTVQITLTPAAAEDPLFGALPSRFHAQAVHLQSVLDLPPNALHLASSAMEANHAFRVGECAWGVQFHPEFSERVMRGYIEHRTPVIRDHGGDPQALAAAVRAAPAASRLLRSFAALAEARER